ncbi:hypothetical protein SAMN05192529_101217 [Arachidicoccus rhizosphaerae]|uniref:Avirulence protein n=1 Tax=Arachidicoccus rhizosphaerae TaxID=551991 RepID=A0A1H3VJW1_9BACT|nr:DUF6055 domain-containing protein [Arachidicoccus rhizosphaerae]SDZ75077.1 hypothetical protein SAMN05192529_101217 [Arachidicoccus rhizosphaerae]
MRFHLSYFNPDPNSNSNPRRMLRPAGCLIHRLFCLLLLLSTSRLPAQNVHHKPFETPSDKAVRIPAHLNTVPDQNDFKDSSSEYCYQRSIQGPDIIIFWSKEYGQNPMENKDTSRRFDVHRALQECERFYRFYVDSLQMVKSAAGVASKYKIIFLVVGGADNTAYGWGEDSVGVLWTPASRMSQYPYGVLAHELGHAFQYLASLDYGGRLDGPITEMAAQYMLWQVYPDWLHFENYHLQGFLKQTNLAFEHPANMYHSPFVLEYWSEKYGRTFYSRLLHQAIAAEDIVTVFKRLKNMDDQAFATDMFEGVRRFITWDFARIHQLALPYVGQQDTKMDSLAGGWYQPDKASIPQNYGYNAIRLTLPAGTEGKVSVDFKGLVASALDSATHERVTAGWRYGFVALHKNGRTSYSKTAANSEGRLQYTVSQNTTDLWLVVMGAPGKDIPLRWQSQKDTNTYFQWPYRIRLSGCTVHRFTDASDQK